MNKNHNNHHQYVEHGHQAMKDGNETSWLRRHHHHHGPGNYGIGTNMKEEEEVFVDADVLHVM